MIVDPSAALVRTPPRDERDLLIATSNSWVLAYDNVSAIAPWLSDALCRVATGSGFSTRELCTDSEEVFFGGARPIILNGIDYLTDRPDLADRAVILTLPRIVESGRKEEADIYADFERELPQIIGAVCDVVSIALSRLPHIRLSSLPRMADFTKWAMAASPAIGFAPEEFRKAYLGNRADAVQDTLEGDLVATAIRALMESRAERDGTEIWEGTCKTLLKDLELLVDDGVKRSRDWPKTPCGLSRRLRRLTTFLREAGIQISFQSRTSKGKRPLTITRTTITSSATPATPETGDSDTSQEQSDTADRSSSYRPAGPANEPPPDEGPSPRPSSNNPLADYSNDKREAVVPKVAVDCSSVLDGQHSGRDPRDLVGICPGCGPVEWERVNGNRVCPICRQEPSSTRLGQEERERFEV
jgi:rubredoxin